MVLKLNLNYIAMSLSTQDKQELETLIREVVREELARLAAEAQSVPPVVAEDADIHELAAHIFNRYDKVLKALA